MLSRSFLFLVFLTLVETNTFAGQALPPRRAAAEIADPAIGTLIVRVGNVRKSTGTIWIGVYTSEEDFLDRDKARLVAVPITHSGTRLVEIPGLRVGQRYALGLFHDLDDNGELDTNFLGLPAEPWAFSGRLRSRLRLPRFGEVSFVFTGTGARQDLRLRLLF